MSARPRSLGASLRRSPRVFLFSLWPLRAFAFVLISAVAPALIVWGLYDTTAGFVFVAGPFVLVALFFVLSWIDRKRLALVGIAPIPSAHVPVPLRRAWTWPVVRARESATWREMASGIVSIVVGSVAAAIVTVDATFAVFAVLYFTTPDVVPLDPQTWGLIGSATNRFAPEVILCVAAIVLVFIVVHAYVVAALALGHARLVVLLLSPREAELEAIVGSLSASRRSLLTSFDDERRGIERQLHDGVQQRLVSLVMALGIAEVEAEELERGGADATGLRRSLASAHSAAEDALADLRRTVRGVHPPVLVEHGLLPAIDEIAGRTAIPTRVVGDVPMRLPAPIEQCAYYVVSEALTNAMKHSGATGIEVRIEAADDDLVVAIRDDGRGGAQIGEGASRPSGGDGPGLAVGGLAGLAERAEVLGGRFDVSSPEGGPTVVSLRIPLTRGVIT